MTNSVIKNKFNILIAVVFILAAFLRFYNINQVPPSLYWDEVSIGYNAFSIAETGRDEYGVRFPLLFKGFEDYKTPGSVYLTAISVKAFGLNEFAIRFPSAFLGTLTVLVTYLLVLEFFRKKEIFGFDIRYIALLTSFLVAVSPWHHQLSRAGFEANMGLFFVVFGSFLFFRHTNFKKFSYLFLSVGMFAVSIYFYRSMWLFTPLLLSALYLINYKHFFTKEKIRNTMFSIIIFMLLVAPFIPSMMSSGGTERSNQVGIANNIQDQLNKAWIKKQESGVIGKVMYERRIIILKEIGEGYISHFLPKYLFLNGDPNPRHGVGNVGVLYIWGALFFVPGIFALFKLDRRITFSVLIWLILSPIPAALSYPTPHALRSINMIPIIQFIVALGAIWLFSFVSIKYRKAVSAIIIGLCLYFIVNYFSIYYGEYVARSSSDWAGGYKELVNYIAEKEKNYEKILISGHYWQPHMFFLFYNKYDPAIYQSSGSKYGFDKYVFSGTSWDMDGKEFGDVELKEVAGTKKFLVALSPIEFELQKDNLSIIKEISNLRGDKLFIISEPK